MHQSSSAVLPSEMRSVGVSSVTLISSALKVVPEYGELAPSSTKDLQQKRQLIKRGCHEHFALCVVVLGCIVWTVWLVLLSVCPNATVNHVMKTESYDNGSFWLLIDPTAAMKLDGLAPREMRERQIQL